MIAIDGDIISSDAHREARIDSDLVWLRRAVRSAQKRMRSERRRFGSMEWDVGGEGGA